MGIQQPNILKLISSDAININLEIKSVACNQSELVKRKLTIKLLNNFVHPCALQVLY